MSFSYDLEGNPRIAYIRLLIADTDSETEIFSDEEIAAAYVISSSVYQSSMKYPTAAAGRTTLPSSPVSYMRVAALLLDALAASKSRIAGLKKLLDVELSPDQAARVYRDQAAEYRKIDDESGAFVVIEQCTTGATFLERWYRTIQRQNSGV
jgi:hypothetical protein